MNKSNLKKYKFRSGVDEFFQQLLGLGLHLTLSTCAIKHNADRMFEALARQVAEEVGADISNLALLDQFHCEESYSNLKGERLRMREHTKLYFFKSLSMFFFKAAS